MELHPHFGKGLSVTVEAKYKYLDVRKSRLEALISCKSVSKMTFQGEEKNNYAQFLVGAEQPLDFLLHSVFFSPFFLSLFSQGQILPASPEMVIPGLTLMPPVVQLKPKGLRPSISA